MMNNGQIIERLFVEGDMKKFPEWVDSWKEQYDEDADCEVLKADIKMVMRRSNGEIVIRHSEYRGKNIPKIKLSDTLQGSMPIRGDSRN